MASCDIGQSATTSDEISSSASIQNFNGANSKKEKHIKSLDEISTDLWDDNAKQ